jgi:methionine synthase II (cobalamin-independent)
MLRTTVVGSWPPADHLRPQLDVKDPRVQSAQEVTQLAEHVLRVLPADRLVLCPSCGLGRRSVELAVPKVEAMTSAARSL